VRRVSKKQAKSNRKVSESKKQVLEEFIDEHGHVYCQSCGQSTPPLNISHIVNIGFNKSLEAEPENMMIQCQEKCHRAWEVLSPEIWDFQNIDEILRRVKKLDINYYNKIMSKYADKQ